MKKYRVTVNGETFEVEVEEMQGEDRRPQAPSPPPPETPSPRQTPVAPREKKAPTRAGGGGRVTSPMSGKILQVHVKEGETVQAGQLLCILEAMKMENEIKAPVDGTIQEVKVREEQAVNPGDLLLVIE